MGTKSRDSLYSTSVRISAERAREALKDAGVKASVRGTSIRFSPHVYNTEAHIDRAIEAIRPFI